MALTSAGYFRTLGFLPCGRLPLRHVTQKPRSPGLPKMEEQHVVPARQPDKDGKGAPPNPKQAPLTAGEARRLSLMPM